MGHYLARSQYSHILSILLQFRNKIAPSLLTWVPQIKASFRFSRGQLPSRACSVPQAFFPEQRILRWWLSPFSKRARHDLEDFLSRVYQEVDEEWLAASAFLGSNWNTNFYRFLLDLGHKCRRWATYRPIRASLFVLSLSDHHGSVIRPAMHRKDSVFRGPLAIDLRRSKEKSPWTIRPLMILSYLLIYRLRVLSLLWRDLEIDYVFELIDSILNGWFE